MLRSCVSQGTKGSTFNTVIDPLYQLLLQLGIQVITGRMATSSDFHHWDIGYYGSCQHCSME